MVARHSGIRPEGVMRWRGQTREPMFGVDLPPSQQGIVVLGTPLGPRFHPSASG